MTNNLNELQLLDYLIQDHIMSWMRGIKDKEMMKILFE